MATNQSGEFETALRRLEEIVATLEREIGLDESVALFREGKALATRCERLLKDAQSSIEAASKSAPEAVAVAPRAVRTGATLFGGAADADDADPDL